MNNWRHIYDEKVASRSARNTHAANVVLNSVAKAMSGYDPQGLKTTLESLLLELPTMIDVQMDQRNRGGDPKPQKKAGRPGVVNVHLHPSHFHKTKYLLAFLM
jgi:hypothetical protein